MGMFLTIGDFSRATHLTVKTLRHYHDVGLLEPADIDPATGYRRYTTAQIPAAQVIRRFRELGMPLEEIRTVMDAPDVDTRNQHIGAHLNRLEEELGRTQRAVASLRDLLTTGPATAAPDISLRDVPAVQAAAITDKVAVADGAAWTQGALGELYATVAGQGLAQTGPAGGLFTDEVFTAHHGEVTIFVPCDGPVRSLGRVRPATVPAAEMAVIDHAGPPIESDRAYGALATYVERHALAVQGPIREYFLVGQRDTADVARWRTEVCWPVFRVGS
ncbi:MerR family transcriptional regulator [Catenulispora pinisilvae]|uniref:MerR family transcriptional regulator n=1 Tax=Catenulispora pinisilvae TaxID=2705253 RepID=UPI00189130BF|nr:MerR family transcriptional regulator [Catenulispora pinisilvae]